MKFLLDTHIVLWAAFEQARLSHIAIELLESQENELFFSAASLWEIAIKSSLGRPDFQVDAKLLQDGLLDNGYHEMFITGEHAIAVKALPFVHKDPFDRMLVAQASVEGISLLTADSLLTRYPGSIRLV